MKLKKCFNNHFYNASENERCPFCPAPVVAEPVVTPPSVSEDQKTVAVWDAPSGADPVVGWLVCVKGEYFGQSFNLKTGNNSVGRSMDMDVPLAQEETISRSRHCIITFDPVNQDFFIQPGDGSGQTYLNDELIMSFAKIKSRDTIKLGFCEFVFCPLCVNGFTWSNLI